jgi:nucleotide-binding universal stress UspA family protein
LQTLSLARDGNWFGAMGNVLLSITLCLLAVTLGHFSAERLGVLQTEASTMTHTILAILDRPQTAHPVLAMAGLAAQRMGDSRIEVLHLRHDGLEGFMPTEEVMTERREQEIVGAAARKSAALRGIFDVWRRKSGGGEWREVTGETASVVAAEAGGVELVIIGHTAELDQGDVGQAIHAALFAAKAATLLVPETVPASLGRSVAIAWKMSGAADRAIDSALALLLRAQRVTVLLETEDGDPDAKPTSLLQRLQQAGVPATVRRFQANGREIGEALIEEAHAIDADLLVMGAYTHSQLSEFILGGATREVLAAADLPVLMHH